MILDLLPRTERKSTVSAVMNRPGISIWDEFRTSISYKGSKGIGQMALISADY